MKCSTIGAKRWQASQETRYVNVPNKTKCLNQWRPNSETSDSDNVLGSR